MNGVRNDLATIEAICLHRLRDATVRDLRAVD